MELPHEFDCRLAVSSARNNTVCRVYVWVTLSGRRYDLQIRVVARLRVGRAAGVQFSGMVEAVNDGIQDRCGRTNPR